MKKYTFKNLDDDNSRTAVDRVAQAIWDVSCYAEDIILNEPCGDSRGAIRDAEQALNKIRETLLECLEPLDLQGELEKAHNDLSVKWSDLGLPTFSGGKS